MVRPWTFALVKPDGVANPIAVRWLLSAMHCQGFVITDGCRLLVSPDMASELYSKHQDAFYYGRLIRHICSGPSVAMRMELREGTNNFDSSEAINRWRTLLGPSKLFANIFLSGCAEFDQIRHKNFRQMFGLSDTRNFCHGSDSLDSLYREFSLFEGNMRPIERPEIELFALDAYSLSEADYDGTGGGGEDQSEGEGDNLDNRIRAQIELGVANRWRSVFVIIGDKAKDQVVTLHHILAKATVAGRPSVLWCYKKEMEFSSHRKKRIKEMKKRKESGLVVQSKEENVFEQFILSTHIRYCYYADSHRILGNTFGMAVLQDFEALTPNLLARTVETAVYHEHGRSQTLPDGIAHGRCGKVQRTFHSFTGELHELCGDGRLFECVAHFFKCPQNALFNAHPKECQIRRSSWSSSKCSSRWSTQNQSAKVLLRLLDVVTEKTLNSICSITAARGRGKSAAMGLAVAGAVGCNFTNIFVTSPSPENLRTLFDFVLRGFEAIGYQEHADFEVVRSLDPQTDKCVMRINIFRRHRQTVQYIHPSEFVKLGQAELLVIDEAAAIPMPLVKQLIHGNFLVFLASTTNGYEGTGRSLSLKLLEQLRKGGGGGGGAAVGQPQRILFELTLEESIRYAINDPVEDWLNRTLCLNSQTLPNSVAGIPAPESCELYFVNRDSLFSFHKAAEVFLTNLMSIYVILAVVQLCLEGSISRQSVTNVREKGRRAAGDVIPWTLCQHFLDDEFPTLCGARIVRVAVHPNFQGMGYGSQAVRLLLDFYGGRFGGCAAKQCQNEDNGDGVEVVNDGELHRLLDEDISPRANLPPLLVRLGDHRPVQLDYVGVSFGLTLPLLKFWKRLAFVPVYLRQNTNDLTGEHSCVMVRAVGREERTEERGGHRRLLEGTANSDGIWLSAFFVEFRRRFVSLLGTSFGAFTPHLAFSLMFTDSISETDDQTSDKGLLDRAELRLRLTDLDLRRIAQYSRNLADLGLITDLLPTIASLYFNAKIDKIRASLDLSQAAVLLGVGLQRKSVDFVAKELGLSLNQTYALLNKAIRRLSDYFDSICREALEQSHDADGKTASGDYPAIKKLKISQFVE
ncbi:N-acetyltransferase 10 [Globodera pallida]|nr:N-acetyltransferase 10 [Globodera pallida]